MRGWFAALVGVSALAGCAQADTPPPPAFAACQDAADHYAARAGEALQEPIPYTLYRVIAPDTAVTMDFNPERLNVYIDDDGIIIKARCG